MGALERDLSKKREVYDRGLLWKSGEVVGVLSAEGGVVGGWGGRGGECTLRVGAPKCRDAWGRRGLAELLT